MNNEQKELLDEAYENYEKNAVVRDVVDSHYEPATDKWYLYNKEEFINKCKTDPEFSERWGLKIEERELRYKERIKMARPVFFPDSKKIKMFLIGVDEDYTLHKNLDDNNIPTNKTIESYE